MKSLKNTRYVFISTLVIIGLFVFAYYWFIRPIYLNNLDQSKRFSVKKTQTIAFGKHENQKAIFGIELEISGNSASNLDVVISNQAGDVQFASLKGDPLDFTYKNDWYDDSCFITIVPRGKVGGKAEVRCRFLSMD